MAITPQPLFQIVPTNTLAQLVYEPTTTVRLQSIVFLNRDASARTVSLYHDIDGKDFVDGTLILKDQSIDAGARYVFEESILLNSSGSLGVKVSAADLVNVVGYGWVSI